MGQGEHNQVVETNGPKGSLHEEAQQENRCESPDTRNGAPSFTTGQVTATPDDVQSEPVDTQEPESLRNARKTVELLRANVMNRQILLRILDLSEEPIELADLESAIQCSPEYATATQPPYYLAEWLVETGALASIDLDSEGQPINDDRREGKTPDELDDLIATQAFFITNAGRIAREHLDPRFQARGLFTMQPLREQAYLELLSFVTVRRSLLEIDRHLRSGGFLTLDDGEALQASSLVSKLADIGAVMFDGGWVITEHGEQVLESKQLPEASAT